MMDRKIICPTLNVMLVKTIKALCEVNIQFDQKLEITGSLHIRSDGEKVLTCLLDEETVKGQVNNASRVAELTTRLSLANAALTLQHVQGVNHPQQIAEALLLSMQGAIDFNSYFVTPAQQQQPQHLHHHHQQQHQSTAGVADDDRRLSNTLNDSSALRVSPISPAQERSAVDLTLDDIRQRVMRISSDLQPQPLLSSAPHHRLSEQRTSTKRVETVAKTLAAIKASNQLNFARMELNNSSSGGDGQKQNHIKLPDIKTLAQPLPDYYCVKTESVLSPNDVEVKDGILITTQSNNISRLSSHDCLSTDDLNIETSNAYKSSGNAGMSSGNASVNVVGQRKKFQCMFCGIFLSTKCYLKNHVNAMHTRSRVYQCELCEHFFYSAGAMRIHKLRNHWHGSKKHRCEQCGENFLLPIELRKHVQKKHFGFNIMSESTKLEPGEVVPSSRSQFLQPIYSSSGGSSLSLSHAINMPSNAILPISSDIGNDAVME